MFRASRSRLYDMRLSADYGNQWRITPQIALPGSAVLALCLGICIYILDRDWSSVQFLVPIAAWQPAETVTFGSLGLTLPTFFHAYAFAMLLILALGNTSRARQLGASAWFVIAAGLEYLQAARFHSLFLEQTDLLARLPLFVNLQAYVVYGRFDPGDLSAAGLGCLTAYIVASVLELRQ